MSTNALSKEEKERILKTLEEDREFRYALMGLIGYKEVLERITKIEERITEIEDRITKIEDRIIEIENRITKIEERQQKLEERAIRVEEELTFLRRLSETNRRDLGALTETFFSKWALEDIKETAKSRGESILEIRRNHVLDGEEVDLLIITDKAVYVVEVKIQPNHHDINDLIRKAEIIKSMLRKSVQPVLACTWVGRETEDYAKNKKVEILKY